MYFYLLKAVFIFMCVFVLLNTENAQNYFLDVKLKRYITHDALIDPN